MGIGNLVKKEKHIKKLSEQQKSLIDSINKGKNVKMIAVAGAGKTTTALTLAEEFPKKEILLMTYNKDLATSTSQKASKWDIDNLTCKTIHSTMGKFFDAKAHDNLDLKKLIDQELQNFKPVHYDLIIIDEAQDLTPMLYELIIKMICMSYRGTQIIVTGDPKQCINQFAGSSEVFLEKAEELFNFNGRGFDTIVFNKSYRVTDKVARFISECYFKDKNFMTSTKEDVKNDSLEYISVDSNNPAAVFKCLKSIFKNYEFDDIMVLANSYKKVNYPVVNFKKYIGSMKMLVSSPEDIKENDSLVNESKGKIMFTTFNRSKGLERKVVIVFGFDDGFFRFYGKNMDPNLPTNIHYVAATRALEKCIIINDTKMEPFNFLDCKKLYDENIVKTFDEYVYSSYDDFIEKINEKVIEFKEKPASLQMFDASTLFKYLPYEKLEDYISKIYKEKIKKSFINFIPDIDITVKEKHTFNNKVIPYVENVSSINGQFFPFYYQFAKSRIIEIKEYLQNILDSLKLSKQNGTISKFNNLNNKDVINKILRLTQKEELDYNDLCYVVMLEQANDSNDLTHLRQVKTFNWIKEIHLTSCINLFDELLSSNLEFEKFVTSNECVGYIDCIDHDNKTVWEFKFKESTSRDDILQLIVYKWLINNDDNYKNIRDYEFKLFNYKTLDVIEIDYDNDELEKFMTRVFELKKEMLDNGQDNYLKTYEWALEMFKKYNV